MAPQSSQIAIREEVAALKRERTIDAAVELFYENGYEKTTLEAVAECLGVTKPFIYSHFSSKAELLGDICSRGISASLAAIDSVLPMEEAPYRKMEILGQRFVTAVLENQKYIAIFTREEKGLSDEDSLRINNMRRDFDRKLTGLIREGVASGDFTVEDPHVAALSIGGMVSWAYVWFRPEGRLTLAQAADEMTKLMLALLQAKPKSA
jgi:TetR/AcrR family transcriptional regulator, cholesterol catabolism regulator